MRAYALLRILPLPLAVPAFAIGLSSDSRAAIVAGFVLLGVWLVDTAIVMPFVLASRVAPGAMETAPTGRPEGTP